MKPERNRIYSKERCAAELAEIERQINFCNEMKANKRQFQFGPTANERLKTLTAERDAWRKIAIAANRQRELFG